MSEWPHNPEAALSVCIHACVCILCVCVWGTQAGGLAIGGRGRHLSPAQKRGHFPGVWEWLWLSSSAEEGSYISNTNHTMGKGASDHNFFLLVPWLYFVWENECGHWFLINKCGTSNLSSCPEDRFYSVFIYNVWMHPGHSWGTEILSPHVEILYT